MLCPLRDFSPCLGSECAAYSPEKMVAKYVIPESCNMFRFNTMVHASPFVNDGVCDALNQMGAKAHGEG